MEYRIQYAASWANAAVGIVAAVLAGTGLTLHPSWLSNDVAATAGVISAASIALSQILPPLQRTPANREGRYLAAMAGVPPKDVADKLGLPNP
jgi:drug/metabolite transporter superfamily protein YnfA